MEPSGRGRYWLEEPVVFDDYAQCAQLTRELEVILTVSGSVAPMASGHC
jgi:hypothetical protein